MKDRLRIRSQHRRLIDQLKGRLIFTIGLLVCCFILTSTVGIAAVNNQQQLGEQKVAIHNDISVLLQSMVDQETGLRGYVTTDTPTFLDPYNSGRNQYSQIFQNLKARLSNAQFQSTSQALDQVDISAKRWMTTFADPVFTKMQAKNFAEVRDEQTQTQGKTLFDDFRAKITHLQNASDDELANLQSAASLTDYGALAASILFAIIAIFWLSQTFSRFAIQQREQLSLLQEAAVAFGAGDLNVRVEDLTDADMREVGYTFNSMATILQEQQGALKDRDILEQVSRINALLTDSLNLTDLMEQFLRTILPLLDIQVAAFYLLDRQSNQLRLFASQGVNTEHIQETFALGEGLIGRVARDRQPFMLTSTQSKDATYFQIKTIYGTVLPAGLYHLPVLQGNDLLGELVVGSLYPISEQTRNVLNVAITNVAAAVSNTQAYAHIQAQAQELARWAGEQEEANRVLRQQRDELSALNAALEEANRARSRFLSTMSHELRTPLTSIIGFGQMLLRTTAKSPLTERQTGNIDRILKNAQHLLTLINDVLDLAKVEAGRMDINATEVNLADLLGSLVEETRSVALERRLRVTVDVASDATLIETDPLKLRQIVLNLLSNALKFTEKGGVTITARKHTTNAGQGDSEQVSIAVKDSGIGIEPELQARIFEAFYQIDNSNSRNYAGTGLGLSIVREFTTLLGGKIEIESEPGQGTTFTIILPLHARDLQSLQDLRLNTLTRQDLPPPRFNGGALSIPLPDSSSLADNDEFLVVAIDDNPDVLQLIAASLEQSPYRVVGVQDATQALSVIQALKPHAVTLDIMMPKVNGWQILHQLKSNPATAMIPVILLTVLEDRSAGYVLGADEYLVKPVARDALIATLHQLTNTYAPLREETGYQVSTLAMMNGEQSQSSSLKPILLVHNEPNVHELIERLVQETGYDLQEIEGGKDVIQLIEQSPPDLLMLFMQVDRKSESKEADGETIVESHSSPIQEASPEEDM
ncbi:ATP-binding protein [Tengunoibacter tsumagoiensis]|uniref:Circadian input-output histidine kinase CikA n=1 Tax=Tengunoibacter tsumagoiensis TaxID=2014871 RepID=A0A402AA96_9CHLR|nr:ATP-binding protein [Tengunoibacter tsumagoiensis]GCE16060.1 hypothetical protein KTT_59190 [Tengunoibacter tsumagoiensis]